MFNFSFGGGMPGMGGMPGRNSSPPRREVDNNKFYELLGVDKSASESDIKKAFRKQAMQHHPDKGGDPEKFKEISKAYETLSDPEKKAQYDEYGEEGLQEGGGGHAGMDIFDLFGGGMFGERGGRSRGPKKGEDVIFPLSVTLEDLYNGTSKKLRVTKSVICQGCKGKGGKTEATCKGCKGQGVRLVIRQIGPGMIQQMQTQCPECKGSGSSIAEKDKCKKCHGEKTVKEKKTIEVHVEKGSKAGEKIVFRGEADEAPDTIPGDVVVVLQQQENSQFKRKGIHLFMKKEITLLEALTGFVFYIQHMDGRVLRVTSEKGQVYKPGTIRIINNEGMPQPKNPYVRGSLYIEFEVKFPESNTLSSNAVSALKNCLPHPIQEPIPQPKKSPIDMQTDTDNESQDGTIPSNNNSSAAMDSSPPEIEDVILSEVDLQAEQSRMQDERRREAYEEEDDEEGHGQHRPGCRAQ